MNHPGYLFLIGGPDLEMFTIKRLLTEQGLQISDLNLTWGAKLSNYQHLFNDSQTFVGIELTQDIAPNPHLINIDHYNEQLISPYSILKLINITNHLKFIAV